MLTPETNPIYVRASVSARCNLNCIYCPKKEGMENRAPSFLRGQSLTVAEYCRNLEHLARNGLRGISFTGGEPTLNHDLPELVAYAAPRFDRVELTTNGLSLVDMLPQIAPHLSLLKVSLDAVDPVLVTDITQGTQSEAVRAITAIRAGCAAGLRVGVNVVAMRSNVHEIERIIALCRSINGEGLPGSTYVSVLDFYYSAERRIIWEHEFIPLEELEARFTARYGLPAIQARFGCRFIWFDAEGVEVRFKDSFGATQRAPKCRNCRLYCQEGIYGLKHSVEGWVTTCPTGDPDYGMYLAPGLSNDEADKRLAPLLRDIQYAAPDPESFHNMLRVHQLHPSSLSAAAADNHRSKPEFALERQARGVRLSMVEAS
jgi:molybdenum cofactor biosynthesis enzyme MoaA